MHAHSLEKQHRNIQIFNFSITNLIVTPWISIENKTIPYVIAIISFTCWIGISCNPKANIIDMTPLNPDHIIILCQFLERIFFLTFMIWDMPYIVIALVGIYVGYYFFPSDFKKSLAIFSFIGFARGLILNYAALVFANKM